MATVHTPVAGYTGTVVGVDFKDGVGETESIHALGYFERQGYTITWPKAPDVPAGAPSKSWKADELRAFAAVRDIDLGDAKTKDEILAVLESVKDDPTTPPPSGDDEPTTEDKTSE